MRRPRRPLFQTPSGYRLRRLHDAARMLPVIGAFLILLPILWAPAETAQRDTAPDGIYLFAVWAGLIVVAALISRGLDPTGEDAGPEDEG